MFLIFVSVDARVQAMQAEAQKLAQSIKSGYNVELMRMQKKVFVLHIILKYAYLTRRVVAFDDDA